MTRVSEWRGKETVMTDAKSAVKLYFRGVTLGLFLPFMFAGFVWCMLSDCWIHGFNMCVRFEKFMGLFREE